MADHLYSLPSTISLTPQLRLGWIGLGSMGLPMAINIQKYLSEHQYPPLQYTDRMISLGETLSEIGGVSCTKITDLVQICDVIFISVSNDEAQKAVIQDIISSASIKDKIIVDTTTVHPTTASESSAQLLAASASFISAPVFGATPLAQDWKLLITAGPDSAIQTITPFLKNVLARNVLHVSSNPSDALLLKTTSNFITAGLMYLISEAHTFASKTGLPSSTLEVFIHENFGGYAHGLSRRMTEGAYFPPEGVSPASELELGIKGMEHGLGIAQDVGMELRLGQLVMGCMKEAKKYGDERGRKMDSSSVFGVVRTSAGLPFETEVVRKRDAEE